MIIKSMARKEPSFESLIDYIHKECTKNTLSTSRNILTENKDDIISKFKENSKFLSKRKGGNYLYHEVITIPRQEKISLKKQQKILIDLADVYLEKRAENLLSYGVVHTDTNNLHIHLVISSNEALSSTRFRLTKKNFAEIQKDVELYKLEKYPELKTQKIYSKNKELEKLKSISQREYEVIKRGGTSKKQEIIELSKNIILRSHNEKDLVNSFKKINFKIYTRGKVIGLENIDNKRRYRFKTLGIENEYLEKIEQFNKSKKRLEELEKREQGLDINREVEKIIEQSELQQKRLGLLVKREKQGNDKDLSKR